MTEATDNTEQTWEPPIEPTKAIPVDIPAANPVLLAQDSAQVVEAESVKMEQSAALTVLADDVDMTDSAAFIVRAESVRTTDTACLILAATEVKGNVTTVFTPVTAAIVGGALLIGMWLIRPRR